MKIKILLVFLIVYSLNNTSFAKGNMSIYDFSFKDIDGNDMSFEKFKDKVVYVTNVASA